MKLKHAFVCAAILALVLTTPLFAGDDDSGDEGDASYFVMIEGGLTAANGGGGMFTLSGENTGVPFGTVHSVDLDESFAPRIGFGMKTGGGWLSLSWSQWDDDATAIVNAADPNVVWDTLYHADDAWDDYEGSASAMRGIDASTIDLAFSRQVFSSDKVSGRWMFGLRQASLDHMMNVEYNDLTNLHLVDLTSEASGFGLVGGVSGSYTINKKWFATGGFQYSFLSGDVKARTVMTDTDIAGTFLDNDADVTTQEDRTFSMFGASTSLVWHPGNSMYFWVGYELTQWNDVVDTLLFPDDVSEGFIQADTTNVNFDGFTIGAAFTF